MAHQNHSPETVIDYQGSPCPSCSELIRITEAIERLSRAFPGGDADGHRRYHEEVIAVMKARKEFWTKLTFELFKWGAIGFAGWGLLQLWQAFLKGPK